MFLISSLANSRSYKSLVIEILRDHLPESIEELQEANAQLLGIYMRGAVGEDLKFDTNSMQELWNLDRKLDAALKIEHRPFDWFYMNVVSWRIEDMADNQVLTEADLAYIEDVRQVNQAIIDAYYDIINARDISFNIGYDDKDKAMSIYKALIGRAKDIASSDAYMRVDAYEVVGLKKTQSQSDTSAETIPIDEARQMASHFTQLVTDEIPIFEEEEDEDSYVFEKQSTKAFEDGIYNIRVDKDGREMSAYLTCKGGGGAYSEEKIDEKAEGYIQKLVPEGYVMYDRTLRYEEQKLEEIDYELIHFDGTYYDASRKISISVDNYGYLDNFDQKYNEEITNMPMLISEESIKASIKGTGFLRMILVRNNKGDMEYYVYMKSNGATYTIVFDALTGEQKDVLSKSPVYYNVKKIS